MPPALVHRRDRDAGANRAPLVTASWIVAVLGVAVVVFVLVATWRRRNREPDLGSVSHQWIAERRMGQSHER